MKKVKEPKVKKVRAYREWHPASGKHERPEADWKRIMTMEWPRKEEPKDRMSS